jgi:hypothetical protein
MDFFDKVVDVMESLVTSFTVVCSILLYAMEYEEYA